MIFKFYEGSKILERVDAMHNINLSEIMKKSLSVEFEQLGYIARFTTLTKSFSINENYIGPVQINESISSI